MKIYKLEKVNIKRMYGYITLGVFFSIVTMIFLIFLTTFIFPDFKHVELIFIVSSLIFGNYAYKYSFRKSSTEIQIKLNDKKVAIDNNEILIRDIKLFTIKGMKFSYYPKIIFELINGKRIIFRLSKNDKDYYEFIKDFQMIVDR